MFRALFPGSSVYYEYIVQFFRNVPPLSMIPLLILWCGIGETTKTVIIVLASFFPMYLNIVKGFTGAAGTGGRAVLIRKLCLHIAAQSCSIF